MTRDTAFWKDSTTTPGLRQKAFIVPGYNCGREGELCQHKVKGKHGIHGAELNFIVGDGKLALSLVLFTEDVPLEHLDHAQRMYVAKRREDSPTGVWNPMFAWHLPFPTESEEVRTGHPGAECEYIESGRCYPYHLGGSAWAEQFYGGLWAGTGWPSMAMPGEPWPIPAERLLATHAGNRMFWVVLESFFKGEREAMVAKAPTERRCPTCQGKGLIEPSS